MQRIQSGSIFIYLLVILFVCPLVLGHVIYERKQRPNRNGDGEQVVEIFRTRCQPPSYGTSDRAVNRFLIDCELSTARRRRPIRPPKDINNIVPRITTTTTTLRTPTMTTTTKKPQVGWPWTTQRTTTTTTTTTQRAIQPPLLEIIPNKTTTTWRPPSTTTEVEPSPDYESINTSLEVMVPRAEADMHPNDNEEDNDRDLNETEDNGDGDNNENDQNENDGGNNDDGDQNGGADEEEGEYDTETDNEEGTNGELNYEEYGDDDQDHEDYVATEADQVETTTKSSKLFALW